MRISVYPTEFKQSIRLAFPTAGRRLQIVSADGERDYYCAGCLSGDASGGLIVIDTAGTPISLSAIADIFYHMSLHEQPAMGSRTMLELGRRMHLSKKLGYGRPPKGMTAESLAHLVRLVAPGGRNSS